MIERIEIDGELRGIIIPSGASSSGIDFLTGGDAPFQIALMGHGKGHVIQPHEHLPAERRVVGTSEALLIRRGRLRVDFYDAGRKIACSRELSAGDVAILFGGAHGFEVLDDLDMMEIKQGPYLGELDKEKF